MSGYENVMWKTSDMLDEKTEEKQLLKDEIFEGVEIIDVVEEGKQEDEYKLVQIEGIASRGGIVNRNGRIYPTELLNKITEKVQPLVKKGKMVGNLDHPAFGGSPLKDIAIRFDELWMEGSDLKFRGDVIPTEAGRQLETLLRSKVGIGMSTRGYGTTREKKVGDRWVDIINDDYELKGIDAVLEQSNQAAGIKRFEHEEGGGNEMDLKELTMEQLKESRSDLVDSIRKELEDEVRAELEEQFENKVNDKVEEKTESIRSEVKQEIEESEELKADRDLVNKIVEAVKERLPDDVKELAENKEDLENLKSMKDELTELKDQLSEKESEVADLKKSIEEKEMEEKVEAKIKEVTKGYRFAELLRNKLEGCKTPEEVEEKFEAEKKFIESVTEAQDKPSGAGEVKEKEEDDDPTKADEDVKRQRKLAGIEKEEGEK